MRCTFLIIEVGREKAKRKSERVQRWGVSVY